MVLPAPPRLRDGRRSGTTTPRWPGVLAAVLAGLVAQRLAGLVPQLSTLLVAVVLGAAMGNTGALVERIGPGLTAVAKVAIRLGVVLLGFRLAVGDIGALGWPTLALIAVTVAATFFGTRAVGHRLGLSADLSLLVATGFSICGASAIAAMEPNTDADADEVAASIGLVTVAGILVMLLLPAAAAVLDLPEATYATWVGASGPDVAQVVAAASTGGPAVLSIAVVVKLSRIVLLAPVVTGVSLTRTRAGGRAGLAPQTARPPVIPGFVAGFLVTMVARSSGLVPLPVLDAAGTAERALFAVALVGLGSGVRLGRLRRLGAVPVLLGAVAWLIVGTVSLLGVLLIGP